MVVSGLTPSGRLLGSSSSKECKEYLSAVIAVLWWVLKFSMPCSWMECDEKRLGLHLSKEQSWYDRAVRATQQAGRRPEAFMDSWQSDAAQVLLLLSPWFLVSLLTILYTPPSSCKVFSAIYSDCKGPVDSFKEPIGDYCYFIRHSEEQENPHYMRCPTANRGTEQSVLDINALAANGSISVGTVCLWQASFPLPDMPALHQQCRNAADEAVRQA